VLVLLVLAGVGAYEAGAARVTYDANGTFLIDGAKAFPLVLTHGPPLGGTTPEGADGLDEVTSAGITVLRAGPLNAPFTDVVLADAERMNEAAAARGAYTWVNLRELARAQPGTPEEVMLKKVVRTLADDSALAFWKGADEPWWAGWQPSLLSYAYCVTTSRGDASWCDKTLSLDPSHVWVTIQAPRGTPADLAPYSAVTDSHGVDVYPVSIRVANPNLHSVGIWTKTVESVTPNRVLWTTLQVCFSGSFDATGNFVLPTKKQERYMIYDAIINGARALNFWGGQNPRCFDSVDSAYGWNWTFWNEVLKDLVLEIGPRGPLYPALLEPGSALPLTTDDAEMQVTSRRVGNDLWVIAARHGPGTANVRIHGLPLDGVAGSVYTEGRSVTALGGTIADTFSQWAVHVYRFPAGGGSSTVPDTWIASGPAGAVRDRGAVFTFASSRARRFECALDAARFSACSSPLAVSRLAEGEHAFRVRAVDENGRVDPTPAVRTWTVDTRPPIPAVSVLSRVQRRVAFPVRWSAIDRGTGVASYEVRYREAPWNGAFGPHTSWRTATAATSARFQGRPGSTYCFSVRALDQLGNISAWSARKCTAVPLDDRAFTAAGRWAKLFGRGHYFASYSASSRRGAVLVLRDVSAKQLSLLVTTCKRCGTVTVFWNGTRVRRLGLAAPTTRLSTLLHVASFPAIETGTVRVRVTSARKRVEVDGLVASST
jgi:hypothetical protein